MIANTAEFSHAVIQILRRVMVDLEECVVCDLCRYTAENVIDMTASVYDPVISSQNTVSRFLISVYYYSFEIRIS